MPRQDLTFESMAGLVGQELGISSWITVDQEMIDRFAETTHDRQWIHVDVERARHESPFGATIAHGYLTLSLIPVMSYEIDARPRDVAATLNYGLDKVRFLTPVRAGSRVRMRSKLLSFEPKGAGQFLMKSLNTVEIEGEEKPALIAETLAMFIRTGGAA